MQHRNLDTSRAHATRVACARQFVRRLPRVRPPLVVALLALTLSVWPSG